jgi:four helix bundle protein
MGHKDLEAWKRAMEFAEELYRLTDTFPKAEAHGLTSQMRRAAVSVPSKLSEGAARSSEREFAQFLSICLGPLAELETQRMLSARLGFCDGDDLLGRLRGGRALVTGLRKSQKARGMRC